VTSTEDAAAAGAADSPVGGADRPAGSAAGARFESGAQVADLLRGVGYLPDSKIATVVHLGDRLGKPVLVEGPAGTGKTELAKSVAAMTGARLIRLQCYEGMDEAKALYEWDYRKQLLAIQLHGAQQEGAHQDGAQQDGADAISLFAEDFLLTRPLLEAIRATEPVVLLVDEVDRLDVEAEALLLEVLSDYQVSIPELGTVSARQVPMVFLTSNSSRELSEALKRRCLYLHIGYPSVEREREIVLARVPGISAALATQLAQVIRSLRLLDLKKKPSVSETLDWARTLLVLGAGQIDGELIEATMPVLLKNQADIELALKKLGDQTR
jgi:MoxR-like ATPase